MDSLQNSFRRRRRLSPLLIRCHGEHGTSARTPFLLRKKYGIDFFECKFFLWNVKWLKDASFVENEVFIFADFLPGVSDCHKAVEFFVDRRMLERFDFSVFEGLYP